MNLMKHYRVGNLIQNRYKMRYSVMETHDFTCRLCATRWLKYTENNIPCSSSLHEDKRHNFDFSKPIKVEPLENVTSTPEVQEGKINFQ